MAEATIICSERDGRIHVALSGDWTLATLPAPVAAFESRLRELAGRDAAWELTAIPRMDSVGAMVMLRAWGRILPTALEVSPQHRQALERALAVPSESLALPVQSPWLVLEVLGRLVFSALSNLRQIVTLIGQLLLDIGYLFSHPQDIPWREFSATLYQSGYQALPVTALVGFLIGIVLSFLSSLQLKTFGADIYIVNLLGISIIRELGPVIVAVLVAGRSGSAMTAQIGVMRVTEEIDALSAMGVSRSIRVVLPKLLALTVVMPLLVLWASGIALIGGMLSALLQLDISLTYFVENLQRAVPVANLVIGLSKGLVFGFIIAWVACHFGLRVKPNTESLSANTTTSVVTAITLVILVDAVFAINTRNLGIPQL